MRTILIALVGLVVLVVAAILIVPSLIDWNGYKPEIQAAARDATGRELKIDGDLSLSILPSPTLSVAGVSLANVEGGSTPDMARLEALDVAVALAPLLSGEIRVTSVTLVKPEIVLETLADGRANWVFADGSPAGAPSTAPADAGTAPPAIALDRAVIEDGRVVYRDGASGEEHTLTGIDLEISAGGLQGPFDVAGDVRYQDIPITISAALGALDAGQATTIKLDATGGDGALTLAMAGALDLDAGPAFRGRLEVSAADVAIAASLASALGATAPAGLPAAAASLSADIDGSPARVTADSLALALGESRFQGRMTAEIDPKPSVELTLAGNRLDLDALLAVGGDPAAAEPAEAPAAQASGTPGGPSAPAAVALPADFDAAVDLKIDAVQFNGAAVRNVQVDAALKDGAGDLRLATAQLPGGTDVTVIGGVEGGDAGTFIGRLEAASDNLRATLEWLEVDLAGVPADRLRKAVVGASVRASATEVQVTDWTMELDATRAQGGLTLALRDRPAFGLSLAVDRINIDAYMPPESAPAGDSGTAPRQSQAGDGTAPSPTQSADGAAALAVLDSFDANVDLRVGEATVAGIPITGARVDALLQNGTLTLRDVGVENVAGAKATGTGLLRDASSAPSVDLGFDLTVTDTDRFARLLSADVPIPAAQLGTVALSGKAEGDMNDVALQATLAVAGGTLDVEGTAQPLTTPPTLTLKYGVTHPDTNRLVSTLAPGALDGIQPLGPLSVNGELWTKDDGRYANRIVANTAGGEALLLGNIDPFLATPDVNMQIVFKHPDAAAAIRYAAPDYRPRGGNLGGLEVSTYFRGPVDDLALRETTLNAGDIAITGGGAVTSNGARPHVKLDLAANRIAIDPWLPPDQPTPAGAAPAAAPAGGSARAGDWSREPIDASGLSAIDADLAMSIEAIQFGAYVVDAAQMVAMLKDGRLDVSRLAGGMFGGTFEATAVVADRPTLETALTVKVRDADVRQAAVTAAQNDMVSGILTYDTDLTARGRSEYELVSNLNGTGSFAVRDGAVQGFDLREFSDKLDQLDGGADFVDLTQRALSGGETRFRSLTGTYQVTQGVLRSNDIALDADAAAGQTTAVIDVPPRQMDVNASARLSEHPEAPAIGVRVVGPFESPRQIFDIDEMQRYVVRRVGTRALKEIDKSGTVEKIDNLLNGKVPVPAGDSGDGSPQSPNQSQDPTRQLEDAARGLLKGILNQ